MGKEKYICKTCKWAQWEKGPAGGFLRNRAGKCTYPIALPPLPISAIVGPISKGGIWRDSETECPVWEAADDA